MTAPVLKSSDLAALDRTVRGAFLDAYNNSKYQPRWPLYASREESTSRKNTYPSIIDAAQIREWKEGGRTVNGIVIEGAEVTNQKWELTYGVRRDDLDDDLTGTVRQAVSRIQSGAAKYLRHPDKLCSDVITGNANCLDGLALFHATHKVNPADPNSETYANTAVATFTPDNIAACRAKMLELKTADGEPANDDDTFAVMVPPALALKARKAAQADVVVYSGTATDTQETNVFKGAFTVIVNPRMAAAFTNGADGTWYMLDTGDPNDRSVIFQVRNGVEIVSKFSPMDEKAFDLDLYVWGTRARHTAAGGNPKKIFRRTAS